MKTVILSLILLFGYSSSSRDHKIVDQNVSQEQNQQIVENRDEFFLKFQKLIVQNNIDSLVNLVKFPLFVECFEDRSKGNDSMDLKEFKANYNRIISDSIKSKIATVKPDELSNMGDIEFMFGIGFSKWGEESQMNNEYGFMYRFELINYKLKLTAITCNG